MRAVIQRVSGASVRIGEQATSIGPGLVVLVGVEPSDDAEAINWLAGKIVRLRVFNDAAGVMNQSVRDVQGEVLVISQFTLFASTRKGNRPSYCRAAGPEIAVPLYEQFVEELSRDVGKPVKTGQFGADMKVTLTNEGPVTIIIDTQLRE
jgi:D-tyrosyl-tRNA(Tyr) deacylase